MPMEKNKKENKKKNVYEDGLQTQIRAFFFEALLICAQRIIEKISLI